MQQQSSQSNNTNSPGDQAIAFDALKDSKFCLSALAMAATESTNNQFRVFLTNSLTDTMNEHFMLSDILINHGWYTPDDVQQQLMHDVELVNQLTDPSISGHANSSQNSTQREEDTNAPKY